MEKKEERRRHVLAVPYPSQGHINPMLQFSKRLASYGIKTTFATTVFISNTFKPNPTPSVRFAAFSDGFDGDGFAGAASIDDYLARLHSAGSESLACLIRDSEDPIDCVVYDAFLPWALDVAKQLGLAAAAFFTQACTVNFVYYLLHRGALDETRSFPIPLDGLSLRDMPSFVADHGSYPAYFELVRNQFSNAHQADIVLVNTVYEFEKEAVDCMSKACPLLTIGPTVPSSYLDNPSKDDKEYGFNLFEPNRSTLSIIEWLDDKPAQSVVYVSFGSIANLGARQMEELAAGLQSSPYDFVWVVRSGEEAKLPAGESKGMIVNWVEQMEVLCHSAVGCFFTHCGWNSTIEALCLGVPMVAMPQWTDQPTNAKLVESLWKVGVRVDVDPLTGIVGRDEIQLRIRQVMESHQMRRNAFSWRHVALRADSSDNNIRRFVSTIN